MKRMRISFCMVMSSVCFALVLSGCMSISSSSSPAPRFYMLQVINNDHVSKKMNVVTDMVIGIGPVNVPEYQDRPQMVTQNKEKMLEFSQFDRWGESLNVGLARVIREDLARMLSPVNFVSYPWRPSVSVKYQVAVEIVQLDSELDKDLFLVAQWRIIDPQNMKTLVIKSSEFRQPVIPRNYSGLAKTLSTVCALLSSEIAEGLNFYQ